MNYNSLTKLHDHTFFILHTAYYNHFCIILPYYGRNYWDTILTSLE
ncbi:hypothetical protein [Myroides odoratimimus]|nr:hypothetical protein [Myroides odoratimimus]